MSGQAILGCSVIGVVLIVINIMIFWSWKTIDHIAEKKHRYLRQILRERRRER